MAHRARAADLADDELEVIDVAGPSSVGVARPDADLDRDFENNVDANDTDANDADKGKQRGRRRLLWFAAAAVVVALVAAATVASSASKGHHQRGAVNLRTAPASDNAAPPASVAPTIGPSARALHPQPFVIAGKSGLFTVDSLHNRVTQLLAVSDTSATIVDRNGSVILVRDGSEELLVDLSGRRPTLVRQNIEAFPALQSNDFWIAGGRSLALAYGHGSFVLPAGTTAFAAVNDAHANPAFLLQTATGRIEVWSPSTRETPRPIADAAHIVATRADRFAWTGADCELLRCAVHVTDVATGADALFGLPFQPITGTGDPVARGAIGRFSPNGRLLAVLVPSVTAPSTDVAVFDLATGAVASSFALYEPNSDATVLPFDWASDSRRLFAVEPGDSANLDRLAVVDARSGVAQRSADALPSASSMVTTGVANAQPASPPLPPPTPLLGEPTGITLANVDDNGTLERLDLDTGRLTTSNISPSGNDTGQLLQPDFPTNGFPVTPLAGGVILIDNADAWWTPRSGPVRSLGPVTTVLAQSPTLAWIVRPAGRAFDLIAVNGVDGTVERHVSAFESPVGAVSSGLVELVPATIDRATTIDVWDPMTGAHRPIDNGKPYSIIGSGGNTVVWSAGCDNVDTSACPVSVTNLATGATNTYQFWSPRDTSVAPDGHAVVFVPESGNGTGSPQVLDVATGTVSPLPRANGFGSTVWGPNGWMFYATDAGLAAWRPEMLAPRVLPGVLIQPSTTAAF
jgi:hypothetical protein